MNQITLNFDPPPLPEDPALRRFLKYHEDNPALYELFKKFTFEAIWSGYRNFGAQMIIEKIRWETGVVARNSEFKISNDAAAFYARLFMVDFPQYVGYFRTRPSSADSIFYEKPERG
jgi:hypothetical protein